MVFLLSNNPWSLRKHFLFYAYLIFVLGSIIFASANTLYIVLLMVSELIIEGLFLFIKGVCAWFNNGKKGCSGFGVFLVPTYIILVFFYYLMTFVAFKGNILPENYVYLIVAMIILVLSELFKMMREKVTCEVFADVLHRSMIKIFVPAIIILFFSMILSPILFFIESLNVSTDLFVLIFGALSVVSIKFVYEFVNYRR